MNKNEVIKAYKALLNEQSEESPHPYLTDRKKKYHCAVDAGAREGIFSLSIVDYCDKLYLIECDSSWNETLRATFSPYRSKIVFCNKFLGKNKADKQREDSFRKSAVPIADLCVPLSKGRAGCGFCLSWKAESLPKGETPMPTETYPQGSFDGTMPLDFVFRQPL